MAKKYQFFFVKDSIIEVWDIPLLYAWWESVEL